MGKNMFPALWRLHNMHRAEKGFPSPLLEHKEKGWLLEMLYVWVACVSV